MVVPDKIILLNLLLVFEKIKQIPLIGKINSPEKCLWNKQNKRKMSHFQFNFRMTRNVSEMYKKVRH